MLIQGGSYGLLSSTTRFHEHVTAILHSMMSNVPSKVNHNLWWWIKDNCGIHCNKDMVIYIDDVIVIFGKERFSAKDQRTSCWYHDRYICTLGAIVHPVMVSKVCLVPSYLVTRLSLRVGMNE